MQVTKNFDWEETQVPLVIFMPNYNGHKLTLESLNRIQTVVEPHDYLIIVGNDGVEEDFSGIQRKHGNRIKTLTIHRENNEPRNGSFIRNYVIKRCKSRLFLQKDGEVVLEGDFIWSVIHNQHTGWRAGNVAVLNQVQTDKYLAGNAANVAWKVIEPVRPIQDFKRVKEYLLCLDGQVNFISYFHYAYCTRTRLLQAMQGYDERFTHYGWEDVSMFLRLAHVNEFLHPDPSVYALHLHHTSTVNREKLGVMKDVFASDDYTGSHVRNQGKEWGEG